MEKRYLLCTIFIALVCAWGCGGGGDGGGGSDPDVVMDIPFDYTIEDDYLAIHTAGGVLKTIIGPWGAHSQPHTGHYGGDAKANWGGLYAISISELTELEGDGDDQWEAGEKFGIHESVIDSKIPDYICNVDYLRIESVKLYQIHPEGAYYLTRNDWRIEAFAGKYWISFGHVGWVGDDLAAKMISAGYTDPESYSGPTDVNLITGDPIYLEPGESVARPQVAAMPVEGHPGYYRGKWAFPDTPWVQIEFFTYNTDTHQKEAFYTWLSPSLQSELASILYADINNPASFRYNHSWLTDWLWRAEAALWTVTYQDFEHYFSIHTNLGAWWEGRGTSCTTGDQCDEVFVIYPIVKTSPFYDAALYHSAEVSYLVIKKTDDGPIQRGEVISPAEPDELSGTMIIKWRSHAFGTFTGYQAIAYALNVSDKLLKIRWGSVVADEGSVLVPAIPTDADTCDGESVTCHDHHHGNPAYIGLP